MPLLSHVHCIPAGPGLLQQSSAMGIFAKAPQQKKKLIFPPWLLPIPFLRAQSKHKGCIWAHAAAIRKEGAKGPKPDQQRHPKHRQPETGFLHRKAGGWGRGRCSKLGIHMRPLRLVRQSPSLSPPPKQEPQFADRNNMQGPVARQRPKQPKKRKVASDLAVVQRCAVNGETGKSRFSDRSRSSRSAANARASRGSHSQDG